MNAVLAKWKWPRGVSLALIMFGADAAVAAVRPNLTYEESPQNVVNRADASRRRVVARAKHSAAPIPHGEGSWQKAVEVNVSWQLTRHHVLSSSASTRNETFRERWSYVADGMGQGWLASPRGRVPVYGPVEIGSEVGLPTLLLIDAEDLKTLLGLERDDTPVVDSDDAEEHLISLSLRVPTGRSVADLTLRLSDDEQDAVHLEFHE